DGIRDPLVTGVQTCALPISERALVILALHRNWLVFTHVQDRIAAALRHFEEGAIRVAHQAQLARVHLMQRAIVVGPIELVAVARSEERRVGEGWRSGGGGDW